MTLHAAQLDCHEMRFIGRPTCPRCGDTLLAPLVAEFTGMGQIRHTWTCESCDHAFRTAVEIPETM